MSEASTAPAGPPAGRLVLRDALLADGRRVNVTVVAGRIAAIGHAGDRSGELDLGGRLLLPAFTEPHAHLDKALVGRLGAAGGLRGAIDAWDRTRARRSVADTVARARAALAEYVRHGTGAVRTHVDVAGPHGVAVVAALAALRDGVAEAVDLQLVAMPATPLTGLAAADTRARLLDALDAGADLVGGAPWVDAEPRAALDLLLDVATDRGAGLDVHVDETLSAREMTVGHLVAAVDAGFGGSVTAGHLVSLGQLTPGEQRAMADELARTGIAVVANPRSNLWLQDRATRQGARRGLTAVRTLLDAGVVLGAGGDNLRDPFSPYGTADPLAVAQLLALMADVTAAEALFAVSGGARRVPDTPGSATGPVPAVGDSADLVVLPAQDGADALARIEPSRLVLHRGRLVASRRVFDDVAVPGLAEPPHRWPPPLGAGTAGSGYVRNVTMSRTNAAGSSSQG